MHGALKTIDPWGKFNAENSAQEIVARRAIVQAARQLKKGEISRSLWCAVFHDNSKRSGLPFTTASETYQDLEERRLL